MTSVETPIHENTTVVRSCVSSGLFNCSLCPPGGWVRISILNHLGTFKDASSIKLAIQTYLPGTKEAITDGITFCCQWEKKKITGGFSMNSRAMVKSMFNIIFEVRIAQST